MMKKIYMGEFSVNGWVFVYPNCSNIQGYPEHHNYNMVKFEVGDTEKKFPNCRTSLYINNY